MTGRTEFSEKKKKLRKPQAHKHLSRFIFQHACNYACRFKMKNRIQFATRVSNESSATRSTTVRLIFYKGKVTFASFDKLHVYAALLPSFARFIPQK